MALYWDFENLHASVCELEFGKGWYREPANRYSAQPRAVRLDAIMDYVLALGQLNINKAYANWSFLKAYRDDLLRHSVDLIQMFPPGRNAKNGADIRMALDALSDLWANPHISVVVIVGGDSDYISVAQKVRQQGRVCIGIGVQESTNDYWAQACNEFKYYSSLMVKAAASSGAKPQYGGTTDLSEAKLLVAKAVSVLMAQTADSSVRKAGLRPMMLKLDSSFDESNYGVTSFGELLAQCSDVVAVSRGEHDHVVKLLDAGQKLLRQPAGESAIDHYSAILRREGLRVPPPPLFVPGLAVAFEVFAEHGRLSSFEEFIKLIAERLTARGTPCTQVEAQQLKHLLWRSFCFGLDPASRSIGLAGGIVSAGLLCRQVLRMLVKRVMDALETEPDLEVLSELFYGDRAQVEAMLLLVKENGSEDGGTEPRGPAVHGKAEGAPELAD